MTSSTEKNNLDNIDQEELNNICFIIIPNKQCHFQLKRKYSFRNSTRFTNFITC